MDNSKNKKTPSLDPTSTNVSLSFPLDPDRQAAYFFPSPMSLVQLYIPAESALEVAAELGDIGMIQFRDVSSISSFYLFLVKRSCSRLPTHLYQ